jgi:hypothetical protein
MSCNIVKLGPIRRKNSMAIRIPPLPQGTRVRIRRAAVPQDPSVTGRTGTVVASSEYNAHELGVVLDNDPALRFFLPAEVEIIDVPLPLLTDRLAAKQRRALP